MYQIQIYYCDMGGASWDPADYKYKWAFNTFEEAYQRLCELGKEKCPDYRIYKIS